MNKNPQTRSGRRYRDRVMHRALRDGSGEGFTRADSIMGRQSAGIQRCTGHHGKAQCRDPEVHRASWEGKVQGSRGAQGIMGRPSAGIQRCTGHHGKAKCRDPGVHRASWEVQQRNTRVRMVSWEHSEEYLSWMVVNWA